TGIIGTLEFRSPDIALRLPMEIKGAGEEKGRKLFNEWRLFAFVDGGYTIVHKPGEEQERSFQMWRYGIGTRVKLADQIDAAVPLAVPMIDQTDSKANEPRVLFNVSGSF